MRTISCCSQKWEDALIRRVWAGEDEREFTDHTGGCEKCKQALTAEERSFLDVRDASLKVDPKAKEGLKESIFALTTRREAREERHMGMWTGALASAAAASALFFIVKKEAHTPPPDEALTLSDMDMELLENMDLLENMELLEMLDALEEISDG